MQTRDAVVLRALHIETVREWVRTKRLVAYRVGRDYRVKRADLDKFLEERRTKPDGEA